MSGWIHKKGGRRRRREKCFMKICVLYAARCQKEKTNKKGGIVSKWRICQDEDWGQGDDVRSSAGLGGWWSTNHMNVRADTSPIDLPDFLRVSPGLSHHQPLDKRKCIWLVWGSWALAARRLWVGFWSAGLSPINFGFCSVSKVLSFRLHVTSCILLIDPCGFLWISERWNHRSLYPHLVIVSHFSRDSILQTWLRHHLRPIFYLLKFYFCSATLFVAELAEPGVRPARVSVIFLFSARSSLYGQLISPS